jgi:hypothetical protein
MSTKLAAPRNKPHKAKALGRSDEAWWYENAGDIEVYIAMPAGFGNPVCCRISRRAIEGWLRHIGRMPK